MAGLKKLMTVSLTSRLRSSGGIDVANKGINSVHALYYASYVM